jgi:hypothetical protein
LAICYPPVFVFVARHRSEQNFTCSQFFAHDLRHVIARPHATHGLDGKLDLLPLKSRTPTAISPTGEWR